MRPFPSKVLKMENVVIHLELWKEVKTKKLFSFLFENDKKYRYYTVHIQYEASLIGRLGQRNNMMYKSKIDFIC